MAEHLTLPRVDVYIILRVNKLAWVCFRVLTCSDRLSAAPDQPLLKIAHGVVVNPPE